MTVDIMAHRLVFDQMAMGALTLGEGKRFVNERLGVDVPFGGTHPLMGTHNCLTRLGGDSFF